MPIRCALAILFVGSVLTAAAGTAQHSDSPAAQAPSAPSVSGSVEPREFRSRHSIEVGGRTLAYTAVAGETVLDDGQGQPEASVFTIAYLLDGVDHPSTRPLTFLFNGGPGSTAVWLHLGAFGPRQLDLGPDPLDAGAPPYALRDNRHTLLDVSDLVFVDPIGTGYSHALGDSKDSDYWGVDEDAVSMAAFIRAYLTRNERWNSPKYLAAESYGTIRVSLLLRELSLDPLESVAMNGVILVSAALDVRIFQIGAPGNDLAYVTSLPTYAATAYYHDALPEKPADLQSFLRQAREFASSEYLMALFQGDALTQDRRLAVIAGLHRFTGLGEEYLRRSDLRVSASRFVKELLRHRGETLAIHDTRFRGRDPDDVGEIVSWDPFLPSVAGPFVTGINSYLSSELGVTDMDRDYEVFSIAAGSSWKRGRNAGHAFSGSLLTTVYVAEAAAANKDFRILVASGYHDLTTTFYGVENTFDHSGIDKDRITLRNYFGGHMMYLHEDSLARLASDVREFVEPKP